MPDTGQLTAIELRPYRDEDEAEVLELLRASLGGGPAGERPASFFRWKHLENPFGRSFMLVAEAEGRIVGLRAFLRWRFRAGERELRAVRAVDTATHPDVQGRGIFRTLTLEALDHLRDETALVFNTPNGQSLSGYLKMGWRQVGRVPVRIRPRLGAGARAGPNAEAPAAGEALREEGLSSFLASCEDGAGRIATTRDLAYLRWRYADAPLLGYQAISGDDGLAIFRVRPRGRRVEATVAEALVRPGDARAAARLLRRVARAAPVDHLACSFARGTAAARGARRAGFLPVPRGPVLVANPLGHALDPDPLSRRSWALSAGDLEVF